MLNSTSTKKQKRTPPIPLPHSHPHSQTMPNSQCFPNLRPHSRTSLAWITTSCRGTHQCHHRHKGLRTAFLSPTWFAVLSDHQQIAHPVDMSTRASVDGSSTQQLKLVAGNAQTLS